MEPHQALLVGFTTTMTRVDSTTFGASATTTIGLEATMLGLVFSVSAVAFLLAVALHLASTSAFYLASYSSLIS